MMNGDITHAAPRQRQLAAELIAIHRFAVFDVSLSPL